MHVIPLSGDRQLVARSIAPLRPLIHQILTTPFRHVESQAIDEVRENMQWGVLHRIDHHPAQIHASRIEHAEGLLRPVFPGVETDEVTAAPDHQPVVARLLGAVGHRGVARLVGVPPMPLTPALETRIGKQKFRRRGRVLPQVVGRLPRVEIVELEPVDRRSLEAVSLPADAGLKVLLDRQRGSQRSRIELGGQFPANRE